MRGTHVRTPITFMLVQPRPCGKNHLGHLRTSSSIIRASQQRRKPTAGERSSSLFHRFSLLIILRRSLGSVMGNSSGEATGTKRLRVKRHNPRSSRRPTSKGVAISPCACSMQDSPVRPSNRQLLPKKKQAACCTETATRSVSLGVSFPPSSSFFSPIN